MAQDQPAPPASATRDNRDLFECPVCLDYAFPPIPQCPNGHIVCSACRKNVHTCPTCRVNMGDIRNLTLEKLAEDIEFPCKFSINGCTLSIRYRAKKEHEAVCSFRLFNCPSPDPGCKWMGCIPAIFDHLKLHDLVTYIEGKRVNFLATEVNKQGQVYWLMVQSCLNTHFLCVIEKEAFDQAEKFYAYIKILGTQEEASRYLTRLELRRGKGKGKMMWMGPPHAITASEPDVKADCLIFDGEIAEHTIVNGNLSLVVQVFNKKD